MKEFLVLSEQRPAAVGKQRWVFVHPNDPDLIVKVPTPDYVHRRSGKGGRWYKKWGKRRSRSRHFLVYLRELKEHFAVRASGASVPLHMQTLLGFAETDMGMGLISRAVRASNGELAPTLQSLLQNELFDEGAREQLNLFFAWLLDSPVIVGDLNVANIVYGYSEGSGHHFVVVDGLGEKNLVPFNSLSRHLNRRSKLRKIARLERRIAHILAKAAGGAAETSSSVAAEK